MSIITYLICVCLLVTDAVVAVVTSCGNLEKNFSCHNSHMDALLQLTPSEHMKTCIKDGSIHRWWHYFNNSSRQIFPQFNTKHEERNLTLTIHDLDDSDEGIYTMDCIGNGITCQPYSINLAKPLNKDCGIPSTLPTVTGSTMTSADSEKANVDDLILTNSVVIVIAVCSVIIVVVVAGTILIVFRKRPTSTSDTTGLASFDGGLTGNIQEENESTMYNELDRELNNDDVNNCGFNSSKLSLLSLQCSPALPKRPDPQNLLENENEYAIIRDSMINDNIEANENKVETNKMKRGSHKHVEVSPCDDGYAVIASNAEHFKDGTLLNNNNNTFPEYSKVLKRKVIADIEKQQENSKIRNSNLTDYNVVFPQINCSKIVTALYENIQKNDVAASDELVTYRNLGSARRRSKARLSRKELQYAILDHTGSVASLDALSYGAYDLPDLVTCQYASIDFEKKAFIAPVRKAPSSWYKRRNRQAKKN